MSTIAAADVVRLAPVRCVSRTAPATVPSMVGGAVAKLARPASPAVVLALRLPAPIDAEGVAADIARGQLERAEVGDQVDRALAHGCVSAVREWMTSSLHAPLDRLRTAAGRSRAAPPG